MIGATTSQTLDLTLINKGDIVYGTSTIKVEIGLKIGSTVEYIPIGIYNIDDIEKTDYTIKITAYDNMIKFERNFITNLGDTLTLQQVVSELTRITGVQVTGSLPSYTVKKLEGFSCREILSYVASICGGNAVITRDGKFTIVIPKDNSYSIGTDNYIDYKREETKYKIGKISCQAGEEVLSKGSIGVDTMELQFENPWVNATILTDIYNKLSGFEYLGYSMKWQGDPSVDVGDIVTITDKKGVVRKHPILSQKFTYTGGLTSEISSKGENKNKNEFSSSGSTAKKVERVVMELALINRALIDVAYIGDLTAGNIKFDTASGTIMDLQTLLAKFVTGENGQFLNLTTDNVVIANAVIKDAMIDSLSLNKLKTGTINTNNINLASVDGGLSIVGPTMQFKDSSNKVRLQLGQDTSGNFSFILRGTDGTTTLIDHTGIKEKAIADKLIKSNMVNDGAIGEQQINYSSLVTGLNKDTNTSLIKASKVAIDLTGQSLEVSFNSLKSNVDNIEVGVENLFLNADFRNGKSNWSGSHSANIEVIDNPTNEKLPIPAKKVMKLTGAIGQNYGFITQSINCELDTEYTVSFWCYFPDTVPEGLANIAIYYTNSGWEGISNVKITERNQWVKKSLTFRSDKTFDNLILALGFNGAATSNKICYCCLAKVAKGNKATDFTLALVDVDSKIEANTTAITATQEGIATLVKETTIEKNGTTIKLKDAYTTLEQTVSGINSTVASHTSSISSVQATADSKAKVFTATPTVPYKVGDLWTAGPTGDIMKCKVARTSGVYTASDWEKAGKYTDDTKANTVAGDLTKLITRVSDTESSISQLNDSIALKVGSTEVTKAISDIQIGGRNLLQGTKDWSKGKSTGAIEEGIYKDFTVIYKDNSSGTTTLDVTQWSNVIDVKAGIEYTLSFYAKGNGNMTSYFYPTNVASGYSSEGKTTVANDGGITHTLTTEWKKYYIVWKTTTTATGLKNVLPMRLSVGAKGYICGVKFEEGTKATDWSPAPEDVDASLSSLETRINAAELKITDSSIVSTVRNSTSYTSDLSAKANQSDLNTTNTNVTGLTTRVNTVEQNITATAITTTISSAINAGTSSISTTQFVMDKSGLTIKNGALTIKNKAGTNVLTGDTNGNLTITGTFINKNSNGVDAIKIDSTNIYFYDWDRNARELGIIYSSNLTDYPNVKGFSLAHNQQGYMTLGYRTGSNSFGSYMTFDKYSINPTYAAPIRIHEGTVFHNAVNMQDRVYIPDKICFEGAFNSTTPQIFKNTGDSRNILCTQVSVNAVNDGYMIQSNTGGVLLSILAGRDYVIQFNQNVKFNGSYTATGSKNSLQSTKSYGDRLINAFETAEYYYSDFGFGKINNNGECYISIDDILQECVNLDCEYHIFTEKYNGSITSIDRYKNYFVVQGEVGTEFSWQYIAKRIGYENVRLDKPDIVGYLDDTAIFTDEDLKNDTSEDILIQELDFKLEDILIEEVA